MPLAGHFSKIGAYWRASADFRSFRIEYTPARLRQLRLACATAIAFAGPATLRATPPPFAGAAVLHDSKALSPDNGPNVSVPAAGVCRGMGIIAYPILMPLSGWGYDRTAWSRDPGQCYGLLAESVMAAAAVGVSFAEPRGSPVFGAGSFDRFFRDALRDKSKTDNFFQGDLGSLWSPLFTSAAALLTAAGTAGADAYRDTATRALPLLWVAVAGNSLPTQIAKKSFGRERPFLKFDNQRGIDEFGIDDDARQSFYSGHASTGFLSAAFLDPVVADVVRSTVPDYSLLEGTSWGLRLLRLGQGLAFYGLAAAVSYSRIEIDQHYMTDVLAGAVVGTVHGQLLYHWSYRRPTDGAVPVVSAMPGGYGVVLSWNF